MLHVSGLDNTAWTVSYAQGTLSPVQSIFIAFNVGSHPQSRYSTYNLMFSCMEGHLNNHLLIHNRGVKISNFFRDNT